MPVGPVQVVVEQALGGLGYELVELEFGQRGLLRVFIDAPEGIRLEDCERASRQLSHVLTVENVDYSRLEVSSPGVDPPCTRREISIALRAKKSPCACGCRWPVDAIFKEF